MKVIKIGLNRAQIADILLVLLFGTLGCLQSLIAFAECLTGPQGYSLPHALNISGHFAIAALAFVACFCFLMGAITDKGPKEVLFRIICKGERR